MIDIVVTVGEVTEEYTSVDSHPSPISSDEELNAFLASICGNNVFFNIVNVKRKIGGALLPAFYPLLVEQRLVVTIEAKPNDDEYQDQDHEFAYALPAANNNIADRPEIHEAREPVSCSHCGLTSKLREYTIANISTDAGWKVVVQGLQQGQTLTERARKKLVRHMGTLIMEYCAKRNEPTPNEITMFGDHILKDYPQIPADTLYRDTTGPLRRFITNRRQALSKHNIISTRTYKRKSTTPTTLPSVVKEEGGTDTASPPKRGRTQC